MKNILSIISKSIVGFFTSPVKLSFLLIGLLAVLAVSEFLYLGLARRTFVFYTVNDRELVVEDRMLKYSKSREDNIIQYVEETLLGPVSPGLFPLISGGTRLISLLYRDGIVYANLSQDAALPIEGRTTKDNFLTFYDSILRNFSYVNDVRFFIDGNAIFIDDFLQKNRGKSGYFDVISDTAVKPLNG